MTYDIGQLSSLKRQWILVNSNVPRRFLGYGPDDIASRVGGWPKGIESWLDLALNGEIIKQIGGLGKTGVGLLFDGSPGLGKTTHAVVTAMEFARRLPEVLPDAKTILRTSTTALMAARPIYYMTFPEFLSRKKALIEASDDVKRDLTLEMEGFHGRLDAELDHLNVRVLVLDDLGKEYGSKYNDSSFDEILRARYDKALPTIITTNVPRENWAAQYGEAMGSFAFEAFRRIEISGKDLRQE